MISTRRWNKFWTELALGRTLFFFALYPYFFVLLKKKYE